MSALRACACAPSKKLAVTWAAAKAWVLNGIAKKWVLPSVPPSNW
jgi:hypothetical protein